LIYIRKDTENSTFPSQITRLAAPSWTALHASSPSRDKEAAPTVAIL